MKVGSPRISRDAREIAFDLLSACTQLRCLAVGDPFVDPLPVVRKFLDNLRAGLYFLHQKAKPQPFEDLAIHCAQIVVWANRPATSTTYWVFDQARILGGLLRVGAGLEQIDLSQDDVAQKIVGSWSMVCWILRALPAYDHQIVEEALRLEWIKHERAGSDNENYITAMQASKVTGMSLPSLSKLCKMNGPVRFKKPSKDRLLIHAGDLARYLDKRDQTSNS